jgi:hypothetical protein
VLVSDTDPEVRVRVIDFPSTVLWNGKLGHLDLNGELRGQTNDWHVIAYSAPGCTGTKYMMSEKIGLNYYYELDSISYKQSTPASTTFGDYASFQRFDDWCMSRAQSLDLEADVAAGRFYNLEAVTLPNLGPMHYEY